MDAVGRARRAEQTRELQLFFEGRGRFVGRDERVGMDASSIPELYVAYFLGLSRAERAAAADALVTAALDLDDSGSVPATGAARLIVDLCLRGATDAFTPYRDRLVRELEDPQRLATWLAAGDPHDGRGTPDEWRFALALWGVLYMLDHAAAEPSFGRFTHEASSTSFREALVRAREVYDGLV